MKSRLLFLLLFFACAVQAAEPLALEISDDARDMIIYYEVGGQAYYERYLKTPTVPAWQSTQSGVTVGFGVDVGWMSDAQVQEAFEGVIPQTMINALKSVNGLRGRRAYYEGLPRVKHSVRLTWEQATQVFERNTLPRFTKLTKDAFRLQDGRLGGDENGALVSIVFNRGSSMSGGSRAEMRYIRDDIARGYAGYVPGHILSMKRLWSYTKLKGLHLRRDAEAARFKMGARLRAAAP